MHMKLKHGRWPLILLLAWMIALFTQAQETDIAAWFSLEDRVSNNWHLSAGETPARLSIQAKTPMEGTTYRILVMFPKQSSAYDTAMAQILSVFFDKKMSGKFTLINFEGDETAGLAFIAEAERERYDLIFSMGSQSTAFLHEHYGEGTVPVVSICSKDPVLMGQMASYEQGSGTHMAYTSLDVPINSQMAYLKRLIDDLNQVAVLYARANTSAVMTQVEPLKAACQRENISVLDVAVEDRSNVRAELAAKVPEATAAMLEQDPQAKRSIFWITGSTSVFREIDLINQGAGKIPVLSAVPNVVHAGDSSAVLSIGVSFENNAQIAALYAVRILTQQIRPGELGVGLVSPPDIAINFKKAREIGLKIPFSFFESASFVYDHDGILVRAKGQNIKRVN